MEANRLPQTTNDLFNNSLYMSVDISTNYSDFSKYILQDGATTTTTKNQKNKVWLHFIRNFLLLFIQKRYAILSDYWTLGTVIRELSQAKLQLIAFQLAVYDAITLSKSAWSSRKEDKI